jgi:glycosyltransferase involved in cell wall biosynthesis
MEKRGTLISIIIPVYKVEPYLYRCLDSVLAQTFTDYECILVDDGSPDNCPSICDEYAAKDTRFKVIHKEKNEGLPQARKSGLNAASADYITHLDSDDWLEPRALELLYQKQQETDADIVMGGIWNTEIYTYSAIHKDTQPPVYFLLSDYKCIWGKLYRRKLFKNCFIPTKNIGEDIIVNIQIFSQITIEKLQKIDDIIYNYDCRTNGIISMIRYDYTSYIDDPIISAQQWMEKYITENNYADSVKIACLYALMSGGITQYLKHNKNIATDEIDYFYKHYYKRLAKSEYIKMIHILHRIIIPIFHLSIPLGKIYVGTLNLVTYTWKSCAIFIKQIIRYLHNVKENI